MKVNCALKIELVFIHLQII